jgi:hypothetical protein
MRALLIVLAITLLPQATSQAPPRCDAPEHRQFDFWIGDWTVTDSTGVTEYGKNTITREEGGCLLHERWRGSRGGSGQSFNFYDRQRKHWEQVWIASTGGVLRLTGQFNGRSMVLEGNFNRIAWTPQPDGRVRQVWSASADSGQTWQTSFDGWYRKP